jgi:hypothetical protein
MAENHKNILPECEQVFIRLEQKIDELVTNTRAINGRYQKHLEEAMPYRSRVDAHEKTLTENGVYKRQIVSALLGIVITIILQVGSFLYLFGGLSKQVEINTQRWDKLIESGTHNDIK